MLTSQIYDHGARLRSFEIAAQLMSNGKSRAAASIPAAT